MLRQGVVGLRTLLFAFLLGQTWAVGKGPQTWDFLKTTGAPFTHVFTCPCVTASSALPSAITENSRPS